MTETVDDVVIINRALARLGSAGIMALDEETSLCRQAKAVYFDRIDTLLGAYDWSFAGRTYALTAVAETADNGFDAAAKRWETGWRYAYLMPGARLATPRKIMTDPRIPDTPLRDFLVEADRIYADRTPLWGVFTVRAAATVWPPAFRLAAIVALAADLCVPISHDKGLADALRLEAEGDPRLDGRGGLVGKAIAQDMAGARRKSPQWSDPLTDARLP